MEGVDRGGGFVIVAHGDETEATGAAAHAVEHDGGLNDGTVGAKGVLEVLFRNIEGKISDEEFIVHLMICCFTQSYFLQTVPDRRVSNHH